MKTKVAIGDIRLVENAKVTLGGKGTVSSKGAIGSAKEAVRSEIDLRGMDTGEAIMELDRYIDSAVLSNVKTLMAIHGKGTGALRTAVQNRLRKHKNVKSYRAGVYGEGENGVTVIELK
jgi:DNA mismatch repair protein MutS2